jgi:hypothetical protein
MLKLCHEICQKHTISGAVNRIWLNAVNSASHVTMRQKQISLSSHFVVRYTKIVDVYAKRMLFLFVFCSFKQHKSRQNRVCCFAFAPKRYLFTQNAPFKKGLVNTIFMERNVSLLRRVLSV